MLKYLFSHVKLSLVAATICAALFGNVALNAEPFDVMKEFQSLHLVEKGGERGPRGHRGKRGHSGKRGHKGKRGKQGPQGANGSGSQFNTFLYAYGTDNWVNNNPSIPFPIIPASSQSGITFDGTTATVPATGLYLVSVAIGTIGNSEAAELLPTLGLGINGNVPANGGPYFTTILTSTLETSLYGTFLVPLNAGDTIVVQAFDSSDSGYGIVIPPASTNEPNASNRTLSIVRVN